MQIQYTFVIEIFFVSILSQGLSKNTSHFKTTAVTPPAASILSKIKDRFEMRKLSCKSIISSQSKFSLSLFSREFITQPSSSYAAHESNLNQSTQTHIKSTIKTHQSHAVLFHNTLNTLATTPPVSSRQRRVRDKSKLEEAFNSAKTSEDMLIAFKVMETSFDERELGLACLKLGLKLDQEGEDPEKALTFANRALNVFDKEDSKASLPLAMTLQLLGSTCYSLKRFNDGLGYLNRANRILVLLEEVGSGSVGDIRPILHAVQLELANTKTAMGRREEAIANLRKCLDIKEMTLEKNSRELGNAYRDLAESYIAILNFTEALPFCLKAIHIHQDQLGNNSVEVARDRRLLGVVYTGLEKHEKALEQNQLSQKVLKNWGLSSDLLRAEIDAANMQIALGRYEEAINTLKGVVQDTDKESEDRALVFISMAKALCFQEKNADSKKCLEVSIGILEKREGASPLEVSDAYLEISSQYEAMNEFETAIQLLKKALSLIERLPQEQHSEGNVSARIGWLLLLTGKVEKAIPYLETGAERLKDSFGSRHFGVGYVYNNLGAAYMELDRPQSAAQVFAMAKEIMEVSLGPVHVDTIDACQNLAKAYDAMKSYPLAIKFQEHVVESWEGHGLSALDERREAKKVLEQLKSKARGDGGSSDEPGIKTLLLPHSSSSGSQHNISLNQRHSGIS